MCYDDRSNSSNFLPGKNDGSTELWMLEELKCNGWLKVSKLHFGLIDQTFDWSWFFKVV